MYGVIITCCEWWKKDLVGLEWGGEGRHVVSLGFWGGFLLVLLVWSE